MRDALWDLPGWRGWRVAAVVAAVGVGVSWNTLPPPPNCYFNEYKWVIGVTIAILMNIKWVIAVTIAHFKEYWPKTAYIDLPKSRSVFSEEKKAPAALQLPKKAFKKSRVLIYIH